MTVSLVLHFLAGLIAGYIISKILIEIIRFFTR